MATNEQFTFSVDSALLGELGERLVPSDHIALSELVKNAYDADALNASISILFDNGSIRYVISDDGSGMTLNEVKKYWMNIGTTHKKEEDKSDKYGRLRTGKKGIGRFCVRRLGPVLKLETTAYIDQKHNQLEKTEITFEWDKFKEGTDVSKITCDGFSEKLTDGEPGTTLTIWGKSDNILDQRGFNYLRRQLLMLASYAPDIKKGYNEDPGFNVAINAPEFESEEEPKNIREKFFRAAWGQLSGKIDKNGKALYEFESDFSGKVSYQKKDIFENLRDVKLEIGIVPANSKDELRDPSLLANYVLNDMVTKWGGVHARYNGFRVYPYGDPGDDWLSIEKDRARRLAKPSFDEVFNFAKKFEDEISPSRSMLSLLSSRSYIGVVNITDDSGLIPKLDRQGFVENKAFEELIRFIRFGIDWSTIYRDRYVRQKSEKKLQNEIKELEKSLNQEFSSPEQAKNEVLKFFDKTVSSLTSNLEPKLRQETRSKVKKGLNVLDAVYENREHQLHHLRLLASTSTTTLLFAHEVKGLLTSLEEFSSKIKSLRKKLSKENLKLIDEVYNPISNSRENLSDLLKFTFSLIPARSSDEIIKMNLKSHIENIVEMFNGIVKQYSIDIDYYSKVPRNIIVGPMLRVELYAPIINVLSNAIKAIIASSKEGNIQFIAEEKNGFAILDILDTGIGLKEDMYEEAFKLFSADPANNLYNNLRRRARDEDLIFLGEGTGMGLTISRDILKSNSGDIYFKRPFVGWSTRVQLKIPTPKS